MEMELYDIKGRIAQKIMEGYFSEGEHNVEISCRELPSGVYFLRASADGRTFGCRS
jgi:hypothetical protein